jgi:hypothetical protein
MNTVTIAAHIIPAPRHGLIARLWLKVAWRR